MAFFLFRKLGRASTSPSGFVFSVASRTRNAEKHEKQSDRIMSHGLARRASSNEIRFRGSMRIVKDHKLLGQFSMGDRSSLLNVPLLETSNGITCA